MATLSQIQMVFLQFLFEFLAACKISTFPNDSVAPHPSNPPDFEDDIPTKHFGL
jgi:hypothetical protein